MHAEDRVLVAVMNRRRDLKMAQEQGWYRMPEATASRGAFFEYVAFYFTSVFGELAWGIHYYARNLGHELVTRRDLLPNEPRHPRAAQPYYKLQLGPLTRREPPIVSLRWRRIVFIHTTWDRFEAAHEINDLFAEGGEFVDRLYHALREEGLPPERRFSTRELGIDYVADLALPCRQGLVAVEVGETPGATLPPGVLCFDPEDVATSHERCMQAIRWEAARLGGMRPYPGTRGA